MMYHPDDHIQSWLQRQPDAAAQPPDELVEHVSGCAECRGALLLLMTSLFELPPAQGIACEQCQGDLAAYIDMEIADGARLAARMYPEVWWHLWTCPDCAATYRVALAIVSEPAAEPSAVRAWLSGTLAAARTWLLELPRPILNLTFDPGPLLVPLGDEDDTPLVLLDREQDGHRVRLSVQPHGDDQWNPSVEVVPPVAGSVSLELGEQLYRAEFDAQGRAELARVPGALLSASDGPGLRLRIERR